MATIAAWTIAWPAEISTPSQGGIVITTEVDSTLREIRYTIDLDALPSDYNQIVFLPPMFPLAAIPWEAGSVSAPGLTEWNLHGLWPGGTPSLELQFEQATPPPRLTTVIIAYGVDYEFTGAFGGRPADENIEVTLREPPVGADDNVALWSYYPELALDATPGEPSGQMMSPLRVTAHDPVGNLLSIAFDVACQATDHTLVYGPIAQPFGYAYSGQLCSVGSGGSFDWSHPSGSLFFLVVGHDGSVEGSYGVDSAGAERPAYPSGGNCPRPQELANRCD